MRQPGAQSSTDTRLPSGLQVGTGVREVATERLHTQGNLEQTSNSKDLAINGLGFFQVDMPDGSTGYTDTPVSKDGSYDDLLPSFNMTAELAQGLLLRAAASKTMMRPALTDIAYKRTASWSSFRFTDGNPALKPTYADQWEVGLEQYLDNGGLLAASYFRKKIDGVVINALVIDAADDDLAE